jgi:hypothetical protein
MDFKPPMSSLTLGVALISAILTLYFYIAVIISLLEGLLGYLI